MALKNKYQRQKQQYSTDGGSTWFDVSPANYRRGRLIEEASEDCNTVEWREVLGSWFCIEFEETVYRWVDSGTYDCVIGDKYPIEKEQVSHNGGSSWEDTGETRQGEVIRNSADCSIDYDDEYFTIEVLTETATIYSNVNGLEYRIDNGEWHTYENGIEATLGQKIQWRGHMTSSNYNVFSTNNDAQIRAFGNINSLYDYDSITDNCYNYFKFFYQNDNIIDVENVILPATTLAQSAYKCMFTGCSNLINTPELPATTLAIDCYSQMFKGCTSLTTAPVLPATTMAQGCYYQMFGNCTSLITPPALPATTLANGCYMQMFANCTSMTSAPTLSATTLADSCYNGMFQGCSSLTTAPALPATTLAEYCYSEMFWHCTSLVNVPLELPALTLYRYCYSKMFKECTNLTTAPVLPATTFENANDQSGYAIYCYRSMFEGCTNLNYIKMMVVNIPDNSDYNIRAFMSDWVYGVAADGLFIKNVNATWDEIGVDGVPRGWIIGDENYVLRWANDGYICEGCSKYRKEKQQLSTDNGVTWTDTGKTRKGEWIEDESIYCCDPYGTEYLTFVAIESGTFSHSKKDVDYSLDNGETWTTLKAGTQSPTVTAGSKIMWKANNLTVNVGTGSFYSTGQYNVEGNLMSLVAGDDFGSATTVPEYYFYKLFTYDKNIINAQNMRLTAKSVGYNSCYEMFYGCSNLVTSPSVLSPTTLGNNCYQWMFYGCTSLTTAPELPATTLEGYCYENMFYNCTSLTTAPELPATTLANRCYSNMFYGCTSLTTAPELPSTTLATYCYYYMFSGCTSLVNAPELPATTLKDSCYMFMFYGCSKLAYVKAMFLSLIDDSQDYFTEGWLYGVASRGTFVKNKDATWNKSGANGIPSGWTVQDA